MDWVRTKSDEIAVDQGCTFNIIRADRVRQFFSKFLRHSKGEFAGKPFELLPWQWERIIAPAFGWVRPDGTRRFRKVGCAIAKKNGKSTLLSGISLYMLAADREPGSEVYSVAADLDQARIIYNEAANMAEASPELLQFLSVRRSRKVIEFPQRCSRYKALSSEAPTKEGLNIHCLLFDELHAQKSATLWNTLRYGGAARRQPLLFWITTAGSDRNTLCGRQWSYAKKVQDSEIIDTEFLPYICETAEDADWTKPETWRAANPSYGIMLHEHDFEADCREAVQSVTEQNNFRRYRLNTWTRQETKWIAADKWAACAGEVRCDNSRPLRCYIGLDLASTADISAAAVVWRDKATEIVYAQPFFWIPEGAMRRRRDSDAMAKLEDWRGHITITPGDVADYAIIRRDVLTIADRADVKCVLIDPWNATHLATELMDDGLKVKFVRQGYASISSACKEFEQLILSKKLRHPDNPVLNWMVGNAAIEQDAAGNIKPSKRKSSDKIDGVAAIVTALAQILIDGDPSSQYESKKLTVIENK